MNRFIIIFALLSAPVFGQQQTYYSADNVAALSTFSVPDGATIHVEGVQGGEFLYDASDATAADGGIVFDGPGTLGAFTREWDGTNVDVAWWGAVPDVETNDLVPHLRAAEDLLDDSGTGGVVHIGKGQWYLLTAPDTDRTMVVISNHGIKWRGAGMFATILSVGSSTVDLNTNSTNRVNAIWRTTGWAHHEWSDFSVKMPAGKVYDGTGDPKDMQLNTVRCADSNYVTCERLRIEDTNGRQCLNFDEESTKVTVRDCVFVRNGAAAGGDNNPEQNDHSTILCHAPFSVITNNRMEQRATEDSSRNTTAIECHAGNSLVSDNIITDYGTAIACGNLRQGEESVAVAARGSIVRGNRCNNNKRCLHFFLESPGPFATTVTNADNKFTDVAHGLRDNDRVTITATGLPSGISASIEYYVVQKTDDTFKLSLTLGGTEVPIATDGTDVVWVQRILFARWSFESNFFEMWNPALVDEDTDSEAMVKWATAGTMGVLNFRDNYWFSEKGDKLGVADTPNHCLNLGIADLTNVIGQIVIQGDTFDGIPGISIFSLADDDSNSDTHIVIKDCIFRNCNRTANSNYFSIIRFAESTTVDQGTMIIENNIVLTENNATELYDDNNLDYTFLKITGNVLPTGVKPWTLDTAPDLDDYAFELESHGRIVDSDGGDFTDVTGIGYVKLDFDSTYDHNGLLGGFDGQVVQIRADDVVTIKHNTPPSSGGARYLLNDTLSEPDFQPGTGEGVITVVYDAAATAWRETTRSEPGIGN